MLISEIIEEPGLKELHTDSVVVQVHRRDCSQPEKKVSESETTATASETEDVIIPAQRNTTPKDSGQSPLQEKSDIGEDCPMDLDTQSQPQLSAESSGFWGSLAERGAGKLKRAIGLAGLSSTDDELDHTVGQKVGSAVQNKTKAGLEKKRAKKWYLCVLLIYLI